MGGWGRLHRNHCEQSDRWGRDVSLAGWKVRKKTRETRSQLLAVHLQFLSRGCSTRSTAWHRCLSTWTKILDLRRRLEYGEHTRQGRSQSPPFSAELTLDPSQGTLQFDSQGQNYYTGDFINNIPFGKGRRQYASGNLYEGMWVNGKRHGYGIFSWSNGNGEYTGQWENGVQVCLRSRK